MGGAHSDGRQLVGRVHARVFRDRVILLISLLLGLRHARDPDHLAAVTTLIASEEERKQARKASLMGLSWAGCGLSAIYRGRHSMGSELGSHQNCGRTEKRGLYNLAHLLLTPGLAQDTDPILVSELSERLVVVASVPERRHQPR